MIDARTSKWIAQIVCRLFGQPINDFLYFHWSNFVAVFTHFSHCCHLSPFIILAWCCVFRSFSKLIYWRIQALVSFRHDYFFNMDRLCAYAYVSNMWKFLNCKTLKPTKNGCVKTTKPIWNHLKTIIYGKVQTQKPLHANEWAKGTESERERRFTTLLGAAILDQTHHYSMSLMRCKLVYEVVFIWCSLGGNGSGGLPQHYII